LNEADFFKLLNAGFRLVLPLHLDAKGREYFNDSPDDVLIVMDAPHDFV
jgi:hypothetical protein